jgi:hypothetical protein
MVVEIYKYIFLSLSLSLSLTHLISFCVFKVNF